MDEVRRLREHRFLEHDLAAHDACDACIFFTVSPENTDSMRPYTSRPSSAASTGCSSPTTTVCGDTGRPGSSKRDGKRGRLIGYPKVDCLVDGSLNRAAIQASLGLDPTVPTVLYAPTWSPQSSLNTIGAKLIPALARLDVNVVVKLHDRSYDRRSQTAGPVDWGHHLDAICRSWHVHAAHGSDVSPYLFVSDALVTDHSSVGFEFALLDRPIVVIDSPELLRNARVGADKIRALQSAATVVHDVDSATRAIVSSLAEPARLSGERRALADRSFYRPGSATARAVDCIYELLELPAPDGVRDLPAELTHAVPSGSCVLPVSRTTHHV